MKRILVVEDTQLFGGIIEKKLSEETGYKTTWVKSMEQALTVLNETGADFFAAVLDFNLPDAPDGEVIDAVIERGIPGIVFTGNLSEKVRETVWSKNVVDYALKDDPRSLDYIVTMLKRLEKNKHIKVLVVDDTVFFRKILMDLLKVHQYQVFNAANGLEALEVIRQHPDIKLLVTDNNMPKMDGLTLTQKVREEFDREQLAIIGISSEGDNVMAARFIKNGANDFLIKQSFLTEEFYCRVTQNIETLEHIHKVKEAAIKDFLTGLYNRRYFFDTGSKLFAGAMRNQRDLSCCMADIDHFKNVNDTYGHDVGDLALQHVSSILKNRMRETDIVARIGGEEFCILSADMNPKEARSIFEGLRRQIADSSIDIGKDRTIRVTISMGVITVPDSSLEKMVNSADALLYEAKEGGRNRVIMRDL